MCSHSPACPNQSNDRALNVQRVKMASSRNCCDTILTICIIEEGMDWLLVLPKAAHELKSRHIGELGTWGTLIPERGPSCCISSFRNRWEVLENLVRGFGRLRQGACQSCRKEHCTVGGSCLGVQNAVRVICNSTRWLWKGNRALHPS